ncbi:MAG: hypothetical protein ACRDKI_04910 [Solirubrobacterales bacterium]
MFTPYYILAVTFGFSCALLSAYAIWIRKDKEDFPGKLYVPIMLIGAAFAVCTLAAVIHGGNEEVKERKAEKAEQASSGKEAPAGYYTGSFEGESTN